MRPGFPSVGASIGAGVLPLTCERPSVTIRTSDGSPRLVRVFVDVLDGLDPALGWRVGLQPDLLPTDRHGLSDLVLDENLLEPDALGPPDRPLADRDLFLRAGHGGVGLAARGRSPLAPVVLVQDALLLLRELDIGVDVRRFVEEGAVVRQLQIVADVRGVGERDDRLRRAQAAPLDAGPGRAAGLAVEVEPAQRAELVAIPVADRAPAPGQRGVDVRRSTHVRTATRGDSRQTRRVAPTTWTPSSSSRSCSSSSSCWRSPSWPHGAATRNARAS